MCHRIRQGALEELFVGDTSKRQLRLQVAGQTVQQGTEPRGFGLEVPERIGLRLSTDEERAGISDQAVHMGQDLGGCPNTVACFECAKVFGSTAQSLIRPVGQRSEGSV